MGTDGIRPRVLRELAEAIAQILSVLSDQSWQLKEMCKVWRKAKATLSIKKGKKESPGNSRCVSAISIPRKVLKKLILEKISRHMKDKKIMRNSQYGFTKAKSCLTSVINFYDEDEGRPVDSVYLKFSKVFDTVFARSL